MGREKSVTLRGCGWACAIGPSVLLVLLVLSQLGDLADVAAAAGGDAARVIQLRRRNLDLPRNVAIASGLFAADAACLIVMALAGIGLMRGWRAARLAAALAAALAIAAALGRTAFALICMRVPGEAVHVGPLLLDAAVVLFSINVCGVMFLPGVIEECARDWRSVAAGPVNPGVSPAERTKA
jgi:hypothetical protein